MSRFYEIAFTIFRGEELQPKKDFVKNGSALNFKSKHYLMHCEGRFYLSLIAIDHQGIQHIPTERKVSSSTRQQILPI